MCEGGGEGWCEIVFVRERECVNKKKKTRFMFICRRNKKEKHCLKSQNARWLPIFIQ